MQCPSTVICHYWVYYQTLKQLKVPSLQKKKAVSQEHIETDAECFFVGFFFSVHFSFKDHISILCQEKGVKNRSFYLYAFQYKKQKQTNNKTCEHKDLSL